MNRIKGLSRTGRVLIAVAVAAGAFGIVSAVQASIPDSNGIIHMCYIPLGTFTNTDKITYLRALDTAKVPSCAAWEREVDAASPQFVQNFVTTHPTTIERQGLVAANGALIYSSGFEVTHPSPGHYTIFYPAGTFNFDASNFPAITAIPINGYTAPVTAGVGFLFGDGGLTWDLTTGASDEDFDFIINQHNGPNTPGTGPAGAKISSKG